MLETPPNNDINKEQVQCTEEVLEWKRLIIEKITKCILTYNSQKKRGELFDVIELERQNIIEAFRDSIILPNETCGTENEIQQFIGQYTDSFLKKIDQEYKQYTKHLDSPEFLKKNAQFLHFQENMRKEFLQALQDNHFNKAKRLYIQALEISIIRTEKIIGLTINENTQLVQAFREMNATETVSLMKIAKTRKPLSINSNDTCNRYKQPNGLYNNELRYKVMHPSRREEVEMTRNELHDAIIEKFLKDKIKSTDGGVIIFLATGGLPGAGKGTILEGAIREMMEIPEQEQNTDKYYVKVDPDSIKSHLPEYHNPDKTYNSSLVHRESGDIAEKIRQKGLTEGYSILYDASMRDSPEFTWYKRS
jgi:hypothetical protein